MFNQQQEPDHGIFSSTSGDLARLVPVCFAPTHDEAGACCDLLRHAGIEGIPGDEPRVGDGDSMRLTGIPVFVDPECHERAAEVLSSLQAEMSIAWDGNDDDEDAYDEDDDDEIVDVDEDFDFYDDEEEDEEEEDDEEEEEDEDFDEDEEEDEDEDFDYLLDDEEEDEEEDDEEY
jgi:hypothetical protein